MVAIKDFNIGYVLACTNMVHLHDEPSLASDVLNELGISWADIKRMGLSDYDMKVLRIIKTARNPSCFADGRKAPRARAEKEAG